MTAVHYTILVAIFVGFAALEYVLERAQKFGATASDNMLDITAFALVGSVSQPFAVWMGGLIGKTLLPEYKDALVHLPWYAMAGLLLLGDDMLQYGWHRLSHSPLLWPLHRAHHSAHYMSARIIYRNNFFYFLLMPGLWISGVLVYIGLWKVYPIYLIVKLAVITGAHSDLRWDEPLYRIKALRPVMWLVQRTISTPATHFAHHAMTNKDGVGYYIGNFGNLLFFWDVLFGTAHITQQYPPKVGLRDDALFGPEKWYVETFYPLVQSQRKHSALVLGGKPFDDQTEIPAGMGTGQ